MPFLIAGACSSADTSSESAPNGALQSAELAEPTTSLGPNETLEQDEQAASATAYFATLPPGAALPTGVECRQRIRPVPENVPENTPYNTTAGSTVVGITYLSKNLEAADFESRIDGDFAGTTDEVIQWAACKWGLDEDLMRAQAYTESRWFAGWLGDCGVEAQPETGGPGGCAATGLMQIRSAELTGSFHPGTWPHAWTSTAFNLDYASAVLRACFEGLEPWLADFAPNGDVYAPGDLWGCMGRWFSGQWRDDGALNYLGVLNENLASRFWETQYVGCADWETTFYCSGLDR